eukprot:m.142180 g.142180  ORF g.142180 m.142180 type:complete len:881 (+) comp15988_c2_seq2:86-2728(+)
MFSTTRLPLPKDTESEAVGPKQATEETIEPALSAEDVLADVDTWLQYVSSSSTHQQHDSDTPSRPELPSLFQFVSSGANEAAVVGLFLQRSDQQQQLLKSFTDFHVYTEKASMLPLLFLSRMVAKGEVREALVSVGIVDRLKETLLLLADKIDTLSATEKRSLFANYISPVLAILSALGNDHNTNFTTLRPLVTDTACVQAFARVFAACFDVGLLMAIRNTIRAAARLARASPDGQTAEDFVSITQFPALPVAYFKEGGKHAFTLARLLTDSYSSSDAVAHILNQTPAVLGCVLEGLQDENAFNAKSAAAALWNGSNSRSGSQAILPSASMLLDIFVKAEAGSGVWKGLYGAMGNLCRYLNDQGLAYLRELKIHEIFHPLMHSKNARDRPSQAACIVANLIGHIENHPLLKANEDVIQLMHTALQKAWANESFEGGSSEPWEPLQGLASLSVNDSNKSIIADLCLDTILEILESTKPKDDLTDKFAIKVIANLAVTNALGGQKERILTMFRHMANHAPTTEGRWDAARAIFRIEKLNAMSSRPLTRTVSVQPAKKEDLPRTMVATNKVTNTHSAGEDAAGRKKKKAMKQVASVPEEEEPELAGAFMGTKNPRPTAAASMSPPPPLLAPTQSAGERGHVMLSYPWRHQSFMLELRSWLEQDGFKVWMDIDDMSGSVLESMSTGVEKADVIVLCLCEAYKTSTPCRTEGEYAYKLGKPIVPVRPEVYMADGWLGALCGNLLYVDFSNDDEAYKVRQQQMLIQQICRYTAPAKAIEGVPTEAPQEDTEKLAYWRQRALDAEAKLKDMTQRSVRPDPQPLPQPEKPLQQQGQESSTTLQSQFLEVHDQQIQEQTHLLMNALTNIERQVQELRQQQEGQCKCTIS